MPTVNFCPALCSSHWWKFLSEAAGWLSWLLNFTSNNWSISENKKIYICIYILIITALTLRASNSSNLWNKVVMFVCRRGKVSPILVSQTHLPQTQPGNKPWASCWWGLSRGWQENCPEHLPPRRLWMKVARATGTSWSGGDSCGFAIEIKTFS